MTTILVSRRKVLTLAGVTLGAAAVEVVVPAGSAVAAPSEQLELRPLAESPITVLSGEGAAPAAIPRQLAVEVVRTVPLASGALVTMTFDPRVYAPLSPAVVAHDGRPVRADTSVTTDPATGLQRVTVVLREAVPAAGDLSIAAAVASGALYPHDLVRRPVTAKAGLRRSRRSAELARPLQARRPSSLGGATAPWGLELDAVWTQVSLAGQPAFRYYVPARITMRSVGPGIAPAPSLAIRLDPRLVRTLEVTSVTRNTKRDAGRGRVLGRDRSGSAFETRWGLQTRLAAGDVVDLEVLAVTTPTGRPLADLTRPVLSVLPARDPAGQRRTGRESLARVDVSWGDDG